MNPNLSAAGSVPTTLLTHTLTITPPLAQRNSTAQRLPAAAATAEGQTHTHAGMSAAVAWPRNSATHKSKVRRVAAAAYWVSRPLAVAPCSPLQPLADRRLTDATPLAGWARAQEDADAISVHQQRLPCSDEELLSRWPAVSKSTSIICPLP